MTMIMILVIILTLELTSTSTIVNLNREDLRLTLRSVPRLGKRPLGTTGGTLESMDGKVLTPAIKERPDHRGALRRAAWVFHNHRMRLQ